MARKIRLFAEYIMPNIDHDKLTCLADILSYYIDYFHGISVICGDFNSPNINWQNGTSLGDKKHQLFYDFYIRHGLQQLVMLLTKNDCILDLLLSNCNNVVYDVIVEQPLVKCDHNIFHFKIIKQSVIYKISVNKLIVVKCYNFDKANFACIALGFKNMNWALFCIGCFSTNDY